MIGMEFSVIHEIHDPAAWQADLDANLPTPKELSLLAFMEAKDKSRAMCIWRAPDQETLQQHVDKNHGRGSVNVVIPIDLHHFAEAEPD